MTSEPKATNPFYILLMLVGVIFALTACAYGVMAVKMLKPAPETLDATAPLTLVTFLDRHGFRVLMAELGVLAVATFAAILTDDFWIRRAKAKAERLAQDSSYEP